MKYQIQNTCFEVFVFWLACIVSWIMLILQCLGFNIPCEIELLCDCLYLALSACIQSQQQGEIDYQRKKGPVSLEMN